MNSPSPVTLALQDPGGVAERLRILRDGTGMTNREFAVASGLSEQKTSKLAAGRQRPTKDDIAAWVRACKADQAVAEELHALVAKLPSRTRSRPARLPRSPVDRFRERTRLTRASTWIRSLQVVIVPDMLQIPDYTKAVAPSLFLGRDLADEDVEAVVAENLARQQMLYEPGRRFDFVLHDPMFMHLVGSPGLMLSQWDRVKQLAGAPTVRLGVIPGDRPLRVMPKVPFSLFDDVGVEETMGADVRVEGPNVNVLRQAMELSWADALEGAPALELFVWAMARLRSLQSD